MTQTNEVRVGFAGTPDVITIHRGALARYLAKGFFEVDGSGAPVGPDGTPYKLDTRGDPIIPAPKSGAEADMIVRPPTDEFLREQAAAAAAPQTTGPAPAKKD